jgi:hypothetical protein
MFFMFIMLCEFLIMLENDEINYNLDFIVFYNVF